MNRTATKFIYLSIFFIVSGFMAKAQDQSFSQFYAAPLFLNPANAGQKTSTTFGVNYKYQWKSANVANSQMMFSAIQPIFMRVNRKLQHAGGIGFSVYQETLGHSNALSNLSASVSGAYNLFLDRDYKQMLSFGLQGGFKHSKLGLGNFTWGSQWDERFGLDSNHTPNLDGFNDSDIVATIDAGITWFFSPKSYGRLEKGYYLGISGFNLTKSKTAFYNEIKSPTEILFKAHGGMLLQLNNLWSVSPNFLIQKQGESDQYNVGLYANYNVTTNNYSKQKIGFTVGSWYRVGDAFIFNLGVQAQNFTAGLSYDTNTSYLQYNITGGGAFEVSLTYSLPEKNRRRFRTPLF